MNYLERCIFLVNGEQCQKDGDHYHKSPNGQGYFCKDHEKIMSESKNRRCLNVDDHFGRCKKSGNGYQRDVHFCTYHAKVNSLEPGKITRFVVILNEFVEAYEGYIVGGSFQAIIAGGLTSFNTNQVFGTYQLAIRYVVEKIDTKVLSLRRRADKLAKKADKLRIS